MVFFRADNNYTGGPLDADDIERKHNIYLLRIHVLRGGVEGGDPYISLTEDIGTAVLKYSYGNKKNKLGEFKYNKIRSKILLIDFDDEMIERTDISDDSPLPEDFCYTRDGILSKLPELSRYMLADKEAVVYRRISEKRIFEVHPLLADILLQLEVCHNSKSKDVYNKIIEGIKSGEYSVQKINDFISTLAINDVEKNFVTDYYIDRKNIVDTYDSVFTYLSNSKTQEEKMVDANCLRAQVLKNVFGQFAVREFKDIKPDLISDAYIPMEEDIAMSATADKSTRYNVRNNIYINCGGKDQKTDSYQKKTISYGLEYITGDEGNVIGYNTLYGEVGRTADNEPDTGQVRKSYKVYKGQDNIFVKLDRSSNYVGDNLNNSSAIESREKYINSIEARKYIRQSHDNPNEYYAFDEDGSCLKCHMVEGSHLKIIDFVHDEQGNISKYDTNGYDKDGYDEDGYDENGLDINKFDRAGTNEIGLPSNITLPSLNDLSEEEVKEKLRTSIHDFENSSKERLTYQEPPLQRLLSTLFDVTSNSTLVFMKGKRFEAVEYDQNESRNRFYQLFMKEYFDKKSVGIEYRTQKLCDKLIRGIISVAKENDIDIKAFMESEMEKKIEENNQKAAEARKTLKEVKERLRLSKENGLRKEKSRLEAVISGSDLNNKKAELAIKRFDETYLSGDDRSE